MLELCQSRTLFELLVRRKRLDELLVQSFAKQLVGALSYLADKLIIHRDVKPQNILLCSDTELKLSDFGLSCKLGSKLERRFEQCGTPNYLPPE